MDSFHVWFAVASFEVSQKASLWQVEYSTYAQKIT